MSKTQDLIATLDSAKRGTAAHKTAYAAVKAQHGKPAITAWSKNLLGEALEAHKPTSAKKTPAKKTPAKPEQTAAEVVQELAAEALAQLHKTRRDQAWKFRASEFKNGRKITYRDACIAFETLPASEMV